MYRNGRRIRSGEVMKTDVCIIGAGAAGMVLAKELGQRGIDVLLVEAGAKRGGRRAQHLYGGEVSDPGRHTHPDRDRFRGLGGSTQAWGGRCMPFDPVDFIPRSEIGSPGWPIPAEELSRWYLDAQDYVDCGSYAYSADKAGLEGELIEGFTSSKVRTNTLERWSPPTHFGKSLFDELEAMPNVTVLSHAVAIGLDRANNAEEVSAVRVASFPGLKLARVKAKTVVMAGGGLETTRLLLNSAENGKPAIGDHSGWLGRGYMCHVMGTIARIKIAPQTKVIFGFEKDAEGIYVRRRLTLSAETLREIGAPNIYALFDRPLVGNAEHGSAVLSLTYLAKRVLQPQSRDGSSSKDSAVIAHLRNLLFGAPQALSVLPKFGRERFLQGRRLPSLLESSEDNTYYLTFHAEQSPSPQSRITLVDDVDTTGLKKVLVSPHQSDRDVQGVVRAHQIIGEELERTGAGRLEFIGDDPAALVVESKFTLGHHIGTTRMSADPSEGVVDENLRVHDMRNVYVASASVFPTSSQAHPTLTILALTIRLAHHLEGILKKRSEK